MKITRKSLRKMIKEAMLQEYQGIEPCYDSETGVYNRSAYYLDSSGTMKSCDYPSGCLTFKDGVPYPNNYNGQTGERCPNPELYGYIDNRSAGPLTPIGAVNESFDPEAGFGGDYWKMLLSPSGPLADSEPERAKILADKYKEIIGDIFSGGSISKSWGFSLPATLSVISSAHEKIGELIKLASGIPIIKDKK